MRPSNRRNLWNAALATISAGLFALSFGLIEHNATRGPGVALDAPSTAVFSINTQAPTSLRHTMPASVRMTCPTGSQLLTERTPGETTVSCTPHRITR